MEPIGPLRKGFWRYALSVFAIISVLTIVSMPVISFRGGAGNMNLQASDCSVHNQASSATISMAASATQVTTGQQITVTVTVSGTTGSGLLGVAILSKTSGYSGTTPQENGWTIVSDPEGSKYSYVEVSNSGTKTVTWTLIVPSSAGTYKLYAKIFDGNTALTKTFTSGISITVSTAPATPSVIISSPADGADIYGNFSVSADIAGVWSVRNMTLYVDGAEMGTLTSAPFTWDIDTTAWALGSHTLRVVAFSSIGVAYQTNSSIVLSAMGSSASTMFDWTWTDVAVGAGLMLILGTVFLTRSEKKN